MASVAQRLLRGVKEEGVVQRLEFRIPRKINHFPTDYTIVDHQWRHPGAATVSRARCLVNGGYVVQSRRPSIMQAPGPEQAASSIDTVCATLCRSIRFVLQVRCNELGEVA